LWDTSFILADDQLLGRVLHTLIGYTAQPTGIQLLFYIATLLLIGGMMWLVNRAGPPRVRSGRSTASHPTALQPGE
jgi:high-affinity iron transporter